MSRDPHVFEDTPLASGDLARLVEQAKAVFAWRAEVDRLSGEGEYDGVRATITGGGAVSGLTVPDAACADGGEALSERIIEAVRAAQDDLAAKVRPSAADTFGEDSDQVQTVTAGSEQRFGRSATVIDTDFGDSVRWGDGRDRG